MLRVNLVASHVRVRCMSESRKRKRESRIPAKEWLKKQKSDESSLEEWLDRIELLVHVKSELSSQESTTAGTNERSRPVPNNNESPSESVPDFGVELEQLFTDLSVTEAPAEQVIETEAREEEVESEEEEEFAMPEPVGIRRRKFNGNPHEDADEHLDTFEETMMDHRLA